MRIASLFACSCLLGASCGGGTPTTPTSSTVASFDLDADWSQPQHYWDFPYPSDLRLSASGTVDARGFPNPGPAAVIEQVRVLAAQHPGFPVVPVGYFRFSAPIAPRDPAVVNPAASSSPLLLLDVDPASPDRGQLVPTVSATQPMDIYAPDNLLAVAPRPGFVLHPKRKYAFVVLRSLADRDGKPLAVPAALDGLRAGQAGTAARGAMARDLYAPLWPALTMAGVDPAQVAAATVFTTGDVVQETFDLTTALLKKYHLQITGLHLAAATNDRLCELDGTVIYPQFQNGKPPFGAGGQFEFTDGGLPARMRDEEAPIAITLPKSLMPDAGYPLEIYFHGSGGASTDAINRGPSITPGGDPAPGLGPAWVVAPVGLATAASALPVNPQRLPGAGDTAYLNISNLSAFRDTFRQGVIEQRLFIEALRTLEIDPVLLGACDGPKLPKSAATFKFDPARLVAQGQSMGGMYTNLVSATEPRITAAVPTGAGGYWSEFILVTSTVKGVVPLLGALLQTDAPLTFMHPALQLVETAWEAADPFVYMPRVARRPLAGHPVRPIYEPVGQGDSYFPTVLYDAIALSYGHQEVGDVVWPAMQDALKLAKLDGIVPYPVTDNRPSEAGGMYTGTVVQYPGNGADDPHAIYRTNDSVKFQYSCFLSSFLHTGHATVYAPMPLGTACPK